MPAMEKEAKTAPSLRRSLLLRKDDHTADFLAAKKVFEDERDSVLSDIPDEVKRWYGQIAFMPWRYAFLMERVYLLVLVLSPYDVSPYYRKKWKRKDKEVCFRLVTIY